MRLDEGLTFQKASLDLTPLIDVVFLLVLFFAVSTSFISREDLAALKQNVTGLSGAKAALSDELSRATEQMDALKSQLAAADRRAAGLEDSVEELTRKNGRIPVLERQLDQTSTQLERERQKTQTLEVSVAEQARGLERVQQERDRANEEAGRLDAQLSDARGEIEQLEGELAEFRQVAAKDREQINRITQTQQILQSNLDEVMKDEHVDIRREDRLIILQLSDQILFDSGSAEIKPQGAQVLEEVGTAIKSKLAGLTIQVAGHTDNVPVSPGQGAWSDNWSLSAARAVNVVRLLEDRVGIDPQSLSAVGYGEYQPVADNDTAAGRAKNRRIELVLVPR